MTVSQTNENSIDLEVYNKLYNSPALKERMGRFLGLIFQKVNVDKFFDIFNETMKNNPINGMEVYNTLRARAHEAQGNALWKVRKDLKALKDEHNPVIANIKKLSDPDLIRHGGIVEIGLPGRHIKGTMDAMGLQGINVVVNDQERATDFIQCGFPKPYKTFIPYTAKHEPLNKEDFPNPVSAFLMIAGGHHSPKANLEAFFKSIFDILEPGGVFFLRDHDSQKEEDILTATLAHMLFNALNGVASQDEENEVRNFNDLKHFQDIASRVGFKIASEPLMRDNDPTLNKIVKFYKPLNDKDEADIGFIREKMINFCNANKEVKKYIRKAMQTNFTKVEWFNVDSEQAIARFYQDFPFWKYPHFRDAMQTVKVYFKSFRAARRRASFWKVFKSDYNLMNAAITTAATAQNVVRGIFNTGFDILSQFGRILPEKCNPTWKKPSLYYAKWMNKYSKSLEKIPSYEHPYMKKLKKFFKVLRNTFQETRNTDGLVSLITDKQTFKNIATGISMTGDLLWRQAFASIVKSIYGGQENADAREIGIILKREKISAFFNRFHKVIEEKGNPYVGLVVPRYSVLKRAIIELQTQWMEVVEIAGQRAIEIEFSLPKDSDAPDIEGLEILYTRAHLQDTNKHIVACMVPVNQLGNIISKYDSLIHRIYDF